MTNLKQRLLVGGGMGILSLLIIFYSDYPPVFWIFTCSLTTLIALAANELYQACILRGYRPLPILGIPTCIAYCLASVLAAPEYPLKETVLFAFALLLFAHYMKRGNKPMENMAATIFAVVYLAVPLSLMFPILMGPEGKWWLLYLITVTKTTDAGAYFSGKAIGKTKMAPTLSPKKTLEGAFFGTAFSLIAALFLTYLHPILSVKNALLSALFISLLAHFGDLCESLLKRDAGVKDSSDLPGLGGFLDMLDSLVFTTPALYLLLQWNFV